MEFNGYRSNFLSLQKLQLLISLEFQGQALYFLANLSQMLYTLQDKFCLHFHLKVYWIIQKMLKGIAQSR